MRKYVFLLITIYTITGNFLYAQGQEPNFSEIDINTLVGYGQLKPSEPEAGDLGSYGQSNVDYATGRNNINIPIHNIVTNGVNIPISLSYTNRAFRVAEGDKPIALGWSLNAGNAISRTLRGVADEDTYGFMNKGHKINYWLSNRNDANQKSEYYEFLEGIVDGTYDGQADEFQYSAGSYSGRFYYHNDEDYLDLFDIVTIPFEPVIVSNITESITYDPSDPEDCSEIRKLLELPPGNDCSDLNLETNGPLQFVKPGYKITTPDGTEYFYNSYETTRINISSAAGADPIPYISKFSVSQIVSPNRKDTVKFFYDSYDEQQPNNISESKLIGSNGITSKQFSSASKTSISQTTILGKKILRRIEYPTGRVEFGGNEFINSIQVFNNLVDEPIKTVELRTNNFTASQYCSELCNRKKLNKIIINDDQVYEFDYSDMPVPGRNSNAVDHWGFYNGAHSNESKLPSFEYYGQEYGGDANREVNHAYTGFGMMTSMTYPTGGKQHFYFSGSEISKYDEYDKELEFSYSVEGNDNLDIVTSEHLVPGLIPKESDDPETFDLNNGISVELYFITPDKDEEFGESVPIDYTHDPRVIIYNTNGSIVLDKEYDRDGSNYYNPGNDDWYQYWEGDVIVPNFSEENSVTLRISTSESSRARIMVRIKISYPESGDITLPIGDLRLDSIETESEKDIVTTRFEYANPELLTASFDQLLKPEYLYVERYNVDGGSESVTMPYNNFFAIYDSPNSSLLSGDVLFYPEVKVTKNDHEFYDHYTFKSFGDLLLQDYPKTFKVSNAHLRGQTLSKENYRFSDVSETFQLLKETTVNFVDSSSVKINNLEVVKNREYVSLQGMGGTLSTNDLDEFVDKAVVFFASKSLQNSMVSSTYDANDESKKITNKVETIYTDADKYYLPREVKTYEGATLKSTQQYYYGADQLSYSGNDEYIKDFVSDAGYARDIYKPVLMQQTIGSTNPKVQQKYFHYFNKYDAYKGGLLNNVSVTEILPASAGVTYVEEGGLIPYYEIPSITPEWMNKMDFSYDFNSSRVNSVHNKGQEKSYLYDEDFSGPVAEVINAKPNQAYYQSFESSAYEATEKSRTGRKAYHTGATHTITAFELKLLSGDYQLTYWAYNSSSGQWEQQAVSINDYQVSTDITLTTNNSLIDDIRIHPADAYMTTYTYDEGIGVTSITDENNQSVYFEYANGRLIRKLDHDRNIISAHTYNYKK